MDEAASELVQKPTVVDLSSVWGRAGRRPSKRVRRVELCSWGVKERSQELKEVKAITCTFPASNGCCHSCVTVDVLLPLLPKIMRNVNHS